MARNKESWLRGEIAKWTADDIIDVISAQRILELYPESGPEAARKALLTAFSVIGVSLLLLGVIVLAAFNWFELPRFIRIASAFAPLVLSYALALYAFLRRSGSPAWREAACAAAILGFATCAGLLSQIYQIKGEAEDLILLSAVLALPFVYALRSSAGTLLYLSSLTVWTSLSRVHGGDSLLYWPLFAAVLPRLVLSIRADRYSANSVCLGWIAALSLFSGLGVSLEKTVPGLWIVAYAFLFASLRLFGALLYADAPAKTADPFGTAGYTGSYFLAFILTYSWPWREIGWTYARSAPGAVQTAAAAVDFLIAAGVFGAALVLAFNLIRRKNYAPLCEAILALAAALCFLAVSALSSHEQSALLAVHLAMNACLLGAGIFHAVRGLVSGRVELVNIGALILSTLVCLRFVFVEGFFENMIAGGLVFMTLGAAFLVFNFFLSRRLPKEADR